MKPTIKPQRTAEQRAEEEAIRRQHAGNPICERPAGAIQSQSFVAILRLLARFQAVRESQGLTLVELAERMGIDAPALSRLETGKVLNPTLATLHKWAEALGQKLNIDLSFPEGGRIPMRDPLSGFDWASLYDKYDAKCRGYDSSSRCLERFGADRPSSDRSLYYRLIECYAPSTRTTDPNAIETYQSLLYWKLYSTAGGKGTNILKWLAPGSKGRRLVESRLPQLLSDLPPSLDRNVQHIVKLARDLPPIPGMGSGSESGLPVRTTFLHFLYPSIVPIFDKMVLEAVGVTTEGANQSYDVLQEYLPFAWELADRYSAPSSVCNREESLRRIDMALWIKRGSK